MNSDKHRSVVQSEQAEVLRKESTRATYEAWWARVEETIADLRGKGEVNLARYLNLVLAETVGIAPPGERISIFWHAPVPAPYLASVRIVRDSIADSVIAAASEAEAIVELGSGWGYNLFNIWLRGGPKEVPYYAFEFTEAGRRAAASLCKAASDGPSLSVHGFDYRQSDLSAITGRFRRVLVYTSHSIEQIESLPSVVIDQLIGLAPEVAVLHFEPVGWQFRDLPDQIGAQEYGQKAHSDRHHYNKNLWALLKDFEKRGEIEIESAVADLMAVKVFNGTSVIRWRKVPRLDFPAL